MDELILPKDFVNKMKKLLGDEWEDFIDCYQNKKYQALRINCLKSPDSCSDPEMAENIGKRTEISELDNAILAALQMEAAEPVPWAEHGYYYEETARPGKHVYHEMGLYYIQEPSAMSAAGLLGVKSGNFVLDLCAAPGGKATQIAAALQGEGLLVANEIHPARCKVLSQNIERMGIGNALVTNEEPERLAACFPLFFDKILVDAPCSGEGMFRKNPEAMQEWSAEQVLVCAKRQQDIMENAAIMLKAGGRLVYSTCTFSPEEDEGVVAGFLHSHPEFAVEQVLAPYFSQANPDWADGEKCLADTFRLWPHKLHGEGHYVAVLKKREVDNNINYVNHVNHIKHSEIVKNTNYVNRENRANRDEIDKSRNYVNCNKKESKSKRTDNKSHSVLSIAQQKSFADFCDTALTETIRKKLAESSLILFGDQLYALPDGISSVAGLKVQRAGLHIGTFKKDRFEPAHALALYMKKEDCRIFVNLHLADSRARGYFIGEGFFLNEAELYHSMAEEAADLSKEKGFCLICIDGFPAGWGKLLNGQIKNHYPKGLRKEL